MPQRLLVSFRGAVPADPDSGARYLDRALALKKRAEAHGGTLCAWSALTFSFDFSPDDLEEAIQLARIATEGVAEPSGGPLGIASKSAGQGFGAGIAEGEMSAVGEGGSLAALSWGMPLVRAVVLSSSARAGEVLVDVELFARREREIEALGFHCVGESAKRLVPGPAPAVAEPVSTRLLEPLPSTRTPSMPPPSFSTEVPRFTGSRPPPPGSVRPPDPLADMAKRALLQGDVPALERLTAQLRETGEHGDLVERMSGLVALRRGATADALRRLRNAAEAVAEPAQKARARLAYAVALASAGRSENALLEALEAMARAREAFDLLGEHACALFLARLSAATGHQDAASVWAMVAAQTSSSRGSQPG